MSDSDEVEFVDVSQMKRNASSEPKPKTKAKPAPKKAARTIKATTTTTAPASPLETLKKRKSNFASPSTLALLNAFIPEDCTDVEWWKNYSEEVAEPLSQVSVKVVGLQHYSGVFHAGEWLFLQREPRNVYDSNAIRVNNVSGGQIGHINKESAVHLAKLLDDQSLAKFLRVEASFPPKAVKNMYSIRVILTFVGHSQTKADLDAFLSVAFAQVGPTSLQKYEAPVGKKTSATIRVLDKKKTEEELDQLFSHLDEEQVVLEKEEEIIPNLVTELLPHQRRGLAWMCKREKGLRVEELPPFWSKPTGSGVFHNEISNTDHHTLPDQVLGGLLADDMGLGKSLSVLALCLVRPGPTLIICPASVVGNWEAQIEDHIAPGCWNTYLFHGSNRSQKECAEADVVITTFDTITREVAKKDSWWTTHKFHRIVLDEAHTVRNRNTSRFKALLQLKATHRWALTGTPLVNSQDDVFCLMSFLRLSPLEDWTVWSRGISKPIKQGDGSGLARLRLAIKSLCLRREKSILTLPPKSVEIHELEFSPEHWAVYSALQRASVAVVNQLAKDSLVVNMSSVLEIILRLRQACCDPRLVPLARLEAAKSILQETTSSSGTVELSEEDSKRLLEKLTRVLGASDPMQCEECAICMDPVDGESARILPSCSHCFCFACIDRVRLMDSRCPLCRTPFSDLVQLEDLKPKAEEEDDDHSKRLKLSQEQTEGSKIAYLLTYLSALPAEEKTVVFSNFTSMLDLCEEALVKAGVSLVRIDGSVSVKVRSELVKRFTTNDLVKVFLISVKAGGTGLNLVRANNAVIMDPWWNSATEEQAWDRVYRLGQTRPVKIVRLVMKNSLEQGILNIQEQKKLLSLGALAKLSSEQVRRMREKDLRTLLEF